MSQPNSRYPVIVIGAGGAGMMCAIEAGKRGRSVLLLEHAKKIGGKILISGGGRCNFTNLGATPAQYVSQNPHFCKSALSRYPPAQFIEQVKNHGIAFHEKKLGQLFCDGSAKAIVEMLESECKKAQVEIRLDTPVARISPVNPTSGSGFLVETATEIFECKSLVIASGGLSIPKIGATGFGYRIARQFGLKIVQTEPALDGFTFLGETASLCRELAGVSVDCMITTQGVSFRENILFTHSGLSGPAALQASLHWSKGLPISMDLCPNQDLMTWFRDKKREGNTKLIYNLLSELLPARLSEKLCGLFLSSALPLPQVSEKSLEKLAQNLHAWNLFPDATVGYSKAEVTRGGVDTQELSSKTMEATRVPGLYFIGEVVDVTGWLGGYNFQWAWASGWAAGQVV